MSLRAKGVALGVVGLIGLVGASGAWAQDVRIRTEVEVVTLQAGEAFAFDDATLSDAGKAKLDSMLSILEGEVFKVDVSGYTDRIGDEAYNVDLSDRRATAVSDYLTTAGIPADKIELFAMGSANPIVSCDDLGGGDLINCLAPNRRTEVRFSYPRVEDEATSN